ncbi:MAG: tRNA adenosine(34) deaminase TadA [Solirubrobacterales bacterium]
MRDEDYMRLALVEAETAMTRGDIPVGAVVVRNGLVIGQAGNEKEITGDPTAHAEMLAIRRAVENTGAWRLTDATLYVTLEPCPMCAGAMIQARLGRLVFGTPDSKAGAAGSVVDILDVPWLNHQVPVKSGVLQKECAEILSNFFQQMRSTNAEKE